MQPRTLGALLLLTACGKEPPPPADPPAAPIFEDRFERSALGDHYLATSPRYRLAGGWVKVTAAYNHPLWLKPPLPRDAVIELDVRSDSPDGDIKVEAWGDGRSHARAKGAYTSSGYVFILGGWKNRISALCRMDEHAKDRKIRKDFRVEPGRTYHWTIRRKGGRVDWSVDGQPFLSMDDPEPLVGPGHSHFGFNDWAAPLSFDNLVIRALR